MAVTFSDLHTEAGIKALDDFLSGKSFISGNQLTKDDIKVYGAVSSQPNADLYPNASHWYHSISGKLSSSFPGKAVGVKIEGGGGAAAEAAPVKDAPIADGDDDDIDLFGDETEEEKKALETREAAKAPAKKKESGKSSVLLDVKPWDDETDMKALEEAVRKIEMPGLFWGACMRNTRADEDAELVELQEGLRRDTLRAAKNKDVPVPVEVSHQPAAPRKRRPSEKDKEVASSPKRRHKGSARPTLADPVSAARGSHGALKEVVGLIADPSRKKKTCEPNKAVEQAGRALSEAATMISQLANTCEEARSSSLAEAKKWRDSFDGAMAEVASLKKRLAEMEKREATLVKDLEDRKTEVVTLTEKVIDAELAVGEANKKRDEALEKVCSLEVDLELAIVEAVDEYKKTDEYKEATNVGPYFDAGMYAVLRMVETEFTGAVDQAKMIEWMEADTYKAKFRGVHPSIPFSAEELELIASEDAKKGFPVWTPLPLNEDNIRSTLAVRKAECMAERRAKKAAEVAAGQSGEA